MVRQNLGIMTDLFINRRVLCPPVYLPILVYNYKSFCDCIANFRKNGTIDLSEETWVPPGFALPLALLMSENPTAKVILPINHSTRSYLNTILNEAQTQDRTSTYVSLARLPIAEKESDDVLKRVYDVQKDDNSAFGGEIAFKYVISELVDNIYQHSKFRTALVLAQRYPTLGYLELAFIDNGITIHGSYRNYGLLFEPWEAIVEALNGVSTKDSDRGWGLRSSTEIFKDGLKGEILIASGGGAVFLDRNKILQYKLSEEQRLDGTLISMRVPYPCPLVSIHQYIQ